MKIDSELLVWNDPAAPAVDGTGVSLNASKASRMSTSGSPQRDAAWLNQRVAASPAEFIIIQSGAAAMDSARIDQAWDDVAAVPHAAAWMTWPDHGPGSATIPWNLYPARLNALLNNPEAVAICALRREALLQQGGFRDLDCPIWDWLLRATAAGVEICILPRPERTSPVADSGQRLPALTPARPAADRGWLLVHLQEFCASTMSSMSGGPTAETIALFAGLYQWHDFLDESHVQSQSIEGQGQLRLGDYWHAIMHRREPDYANSRYWFRQVGRQPIFKELATCADRILQEHTRAGRPGDAERWRSLLMRGDTWNPAAFVDLCEACHGRDDPLTFAARRIQQAEMALLMQATIAAAI